MHTFESINSSRDFIEKKNTVIIAVFQSVVRLANCNSLILIIKSLCIRNNLKKNQKDITYVYKFSSILLQIHKDLVNYSYKRLFRKSSTRQYKLNIFLIQTTIIYRVQVLLPTCMYVMFLYCICGNRFLSSFTVLSKNGLPKIVILISRNFCHIKNSFFKVNFFTFQFHEKIFWIIVFLLVHCVKLTIH